MDLKALLLVGLLALTPAALARSTAAAAVGAGAAIALSDSRGSTKFDNATCSVTFSPKRGATKVVIDTISQAKRSIHVLAYNYTSLPIGEAIRAKLKDGVKVRIIVDKVSPYQKNAQIWRDKAAGAETYVDKSHRIMHNKVIIIDEFTFITGSFNFTANAETVNAENVMICNSTVGAQAYLKEWAHLKTKAQPLPDRAAK